MDEYVTKSGDMWDIISYALTGSHEQTESLMKANMQYADTYIFPAGVKLVVPDFEAIVTEADMPPWKSGED
jgi:phage tail protein X